MRCHTIPEQGGRTGPVHLQCLTQYHRLESFTVYNLLYCISQHIWYTWDHYLPPSSMDIRWQDETGDTFALRNENRLVDLLHDFRPQWLEGQECGLIFPNHIRPFTSHLQPYIMRMSCHEALPIATCFLELVKKFLYIADLVLASCLCSCSCSFGSFSNFLALFQHLAPAVP